MKKLVYLLTIRGKIMNLKKFKQNKSTAMLLLASLSLTAALPASAECLRLGYVETVSVDEEFDDARIVIREVSGSGNTWYVTLPTITTSTAVANISAASNAATSGAKVRIEGDAASCPSSAPLGFKFMGTIEQISIVTTSIND